MRIFKAVLVVFLIVIFIALLVSAYSQYRITLSTAGLVDTTSSITNQLVLDSLAYESGGNVMEYVIDTGKAPSLEFRQEIGEENFEFQFTIRYDPENEQVLGPYGPTPPKDRPVCTISVPVAMYQNNRLEPAKLEVSVWRV